MSNPEESQPLSRGMYLRLLIGLPLVAIFAVGLAINVGVQTHAYFEARDSVSHFEEKRKEEAQEDPSIDLQAPPHPHSRLGEAQEVRTRVGERWLLSFAGFLFFGGLAVLGGRRLAQARR